METNNNSPPKPVILVDLEDDDDEIMVLPPPTTSSQQEEQLQTLKSIESRDEATATPKNPNPQRKMIQQCLALLLHAQRCDILQEESSEVQIKCVQPHCSSMKDLLKHQESCQTNQKCSVPRCSSSRMILRHWDNCKREDCPLCSPLRQRFNVQGPPEAQKPEKVPKKSKTPSFVPPIFGNDSQLLPNPFAACRSRRSFEGESWDDDPVEVPLSPKSGSGVDKRLGNVSLIASTPKTGGHSRPHFDWVSAISRFKTQWNPSQNNSKGRSHESRQNKGSRHRNLCNSRSRNYSSNEKRSFRPESQSQSKSTFTSRLDVQSPRASFDSRANESSVAACEPKETDQMKTRQEQMLMLVHAFKCRRNDSEGLPPRCMNPTCRSTKHLLDHMRDCERTLDCWVPRCISSKRILIHVNECRDEECKLCSPLASSRSGESTRGTS